jgi:hypothetical protein
MILSISKIYPPNMNIFACPNMKMAHHLLGSKHDLTLNGD